MRGKSHRRINDLGAESRQKHPNHRSKPPLLLKRQVPNPDPRSQTLTLAPTTTATTGNGPPLPIVWTACARPEGTPMPVSQSRRTVMPLTGTYRRIDAHLSLSAYTALQLAIEHLGRAHTQRPTASALVRVALIDFCNQLQNMTDPEREREAMRVQSHSKAFRPDPEDAERALAALETLGEGSPLPSLAGVLAGPSGPFDVAAFEAKVSATLKSIGPRRFKDGL